MSNDGPTPRRPSTTILAAFDIFVGLVGGAAAVFLTVAMGLSVHLEDSIPPVMLTVACVGLGVAGILLLQHGRGSRAPQAVWAAGLAGLTAAGGIAVAVWRHVALRSSEGGMLMLAGLMAVVALGALAEVAYLSWLPSQKPAERSAASGPA